MDILATVREIGFFEEMNNLSAVLDDPAIREEVEPYLPLPESGKAWNGAKKMGDICHWLRQFRKTRYVFYNPELELIRQLLREEPHSEGILVLPADLEHAAEERLRANIPGDVPVSCIKEPQFPKGVCPYNGVLVIFGYIAGRHLMVLPETYRQLQTYGSFYGRKVFVPYLELDSAERYQGWLEMNPNMFTDIWMEGENNDE